MDLKEVIQAAAGDRNKPKVSLTERFRSIAADTPPKVQYVGRDRPSPPSRSAARPTVRRDPRTRVQHIGVDFAPTIAPAKQAFSQRIKQRALATKQIGGFNPRANALAQAIGMRARAVATQPSSQRIQQLRNRFSRTQTASTRGRLSGGPQRGGGRFFNSTPRTFNNSNGFSRFGGQGPRNYKRVSIKQRLSARRLVNNSNSSFQPKMRQKRAMSASPRRNWRQRGGGRGNGRLQNNRSKSFSASGQRGAGKSRGAGRARGRGRGGRGGGGRGGKVSVDDLDKDLDNYMSKAKGYLDRDLDAYMSKKK